MADRELFEELPEQQAAARRRGAPRLLTADRRQIMLRAVDLDALVAQDDPVRDVRGFVEGLDLSALHAAIEAREGEPGRPPIDPQILMALRLYATVRGAGSARALERLCEREIGFEWRCGGVGVNHHTLPDFRLAHGELLDRLSLDGMRVRAGAGAASFRRRASPEKPAQRVSRRTHGGLSEAIRGFCKAPALAGIAFGLASLFLLSPSVAAPSADDPGWPLLAAPPGSGKPAPPRAADADAAAYARCMKLTQTNPAAARKLAQDWHAKGGAHPAEHCLCVALIGLKQYKEAANRLEKLAQDMVHAPAGLRAGVLAQAAQAWLLAGDPGRAYAADGLALGLRPDDPELLVDRAVAAGSARWFDKALADLDRVLAADPSRVDALIYRASANRGLNRLDPALADIDAALKLAPESAPALLERGNIRSLRGETDGARRDWARAAELASGGAAAAAAKANIARLDAARDHPKQPAAPQAKPAAAR